MTDDVPEIDVHGVFIHDPEKCAGEDCCFHHPSDHPLNDAPWHIRFEQPVYRVKWDGRNELVVRAEYLTERTCSHGLRHPDPDSLDYLRRVAGDDDVDALCLHDCDGCCEI